MRSSASSLRLAGAAILLLASVPAFAADATAPTPSDAATTDTGAAPAAKTEKKAKSERKICRTEIASESRLGAKKICMTAAEWRRREG